MKLSTKWRIKLVFLLLSFCYITAVAQDKAVTIKLKDATLKELFSAIEDQSSYRFAYRNVVLDNKPNITISKKNTLVSEVLKTALTNRDLGFSIVSEASIVIFDKKQTEPTKVAQKINVKGIVLDIHGEPIIGATIQVKGGSTGTITDYEGYFTLKEIDSQAVLLITYLGYISKEIKINNQSDLKIILEENQVALDELIVVGYGIQKKSSMTAAIGTVKTDDLLNVPRPNVLSAMQGRIAGLTINETSGEPGSSPEILIRGVGTIDGVYGGTSPLIIIDGVPSDNLGQITSYDIESISVLKDGAAAAIYGARAANGVILVTTKTGSIEDKKPIIQFNSYVGFQTLAYKPQVLSAYQYASLLNEVSRNEEQPEIFGATDMAMFQNGEVDDYHGNTNWSKQAISDVAPILTNHLSVSGNGSLGHYYMSAEYVSQEGMIKKIENYERMNLRASINSNINKYVQVRFANNYIRTHKTSSDLGYMFNDIHSTPAIGNVKYNNGMWGSAIFANNTFLWTSGNPAQTIETYGPKDIYWNSLNTSGTLAVTPIKDLVLKTMVSYRNSWYDTQDFSKSWESWDPTTDNTTTGDASLTEYWGKEYKYDFQATADYALTFGKHEFKALAGFSSESLRKDYVNLSRKKFLTNSLHEIDAGDVSTQATGGSADQWSFMSVFGRLNYNYDNKYLIEGNLRYDGSSYIAPEHRWGIFPSVSVGWNIAEESFLKENSPFEILKLRMSVGQLGNAEKIGLYQWFDGISIAPYYNFNGTMVTGSRPDYLANKNLKWESTTSYNLGLDGNLFKGKLSFEVDLWRKNTDDILLSMPISLTVGGPKADVATNAGRVASHGFDFSVGTRGKISNSLNYDIMLSLTGWNSWIVDLGDRATAFSDKLRPGGDLGNLYGYECLGIINDETTLDEYSKLDGVSTEIVKLGDLQYKDQNGDGKLDYLDVVKIGNSYTKNNFGLNFNLGYKNFDTQLFFQGAFNVDRVISGNTRTSFQNFTSPDANQLDRWTEENRNAEALFPRLRREAVHNTSVMSDFWVKNGNYLKLKNFQLGYNFPKTLTNKMGIQTLRFYLSATNLFTIAPDYLTGYDPETDMDPTRYPSLRVYSVGFNLKF